ncbi:MAG: SDR family NAD(P)-dependent oxidoreductase [Sandaracinaceae bacterium]|nr:SDR family NAD(P)-dependent oxidoreductase [Sandaracinaceae bacterium]
MSGAFDGKRLLVTGASSGIGRAVALAFADAGASLVLVARREGALDMVASEVEQRGHARPRVLAADLSKRGVAAMVADEARAHGGRVDILVNNAGAGIAGTQLGVADDDDARALFETNYWSPLALARGLFGDASPTHEFSIVNVSSLIAGFPVATAGHYSSSKSALALATEALRLELVGRPARVLHVIPGPVETPMLADLRSVRGAAKMVERLPRAQPEELATGILRALENDEGTLVMPRSLGFVRHLPTVMLALGQKRARPLREVRPAPSSSPSSTSSGTP